MIQMGKEENAMKRLVLLIVTVLMQGQARAEPVLYGLDTSGASFGLYEINKETGDRTFISERLSLIWFLLPAYDAPRHVSFSTDASNTLIWIIPSLGDSDHGATGVMFPFPKP